MKKKKITKSFKLEVEYYEDGSSKVGFKIPQKSIPKTVGDVVPLLGGLEMGRQKLIRVIESKEDMDSPITLEDLAK
jgi:hypothetical protein